MSSLRPFLSFFRPGQQSLRSSSHAAPQEPWYLQPQSSSHHDLPSFLEHASRSDLDPSSTTYVGTHYEYTVKSSLERMGMSLQRVGGKSDNGIDLLGTWSLPAARQPLKVLIQCKALARKIDPAQARELEGAFASAPQGWRDSGLLGLLVTQKSATKGVRETIGRSRWPMGYVLCAADGKILQMLWNQRAAQEGLEGFRVELKYSGGNREAKEVVLTWRGDVISGREPRDS